MGEKGGSKKKEIQTILHYQSYQLFLLVLLVKLITIIMKNKEILNFFLIYGDCIVV